MNTQLAPTDFDMSRVSAQALAAIAAATPGTREHGAAVAAALMEGYGLIQTAAAVADNIDALTTEAMALEYEAIKTIDNCNKEAGRSRDMWARAQAIWKLINEIEIAHSGGWLRQGICQIRECAAPMRLAV